MILAGMDVARVNLAHGSGTDHARRIAHIRALARQLNQPVAVLADLPGPKFRLGDIQFGPRKLEPGGVIVLATQSDDPAVLPVRNVELLHALQEGEAVYLADGAVELRVSRSGGERVTCEVVIGGSVRSGSGINVPESDLGPLVPTHEDRQHLAFALAQGVEWVGVSFVQSTSDLSRVRACFTDGRRALLMAKIEKRRALTDLDAIIAASDGVMVARGDLGVETDLARIALVQKRIIAAANAKARPVVTATQMLESMVEHEHPTRAEVSDVTNAVLDGTDAVMLSGETAIGRHPVAAVAMLERVLRATEAQQTLDTDSAPWAAHPNGAIIFSASKLAARLGARAIIARVQNFDAAAALASYATVAPLLLITDSERLARALAVIRGVAPLYLSDTADVPACLAQVREWLYMRQLARPGDTAVMLRSSSSGTAGKADTVQALVLE